MSKNKSGNFPVRSRGSSLPQAAYSKADQPIIKRALTGSLFAFLATAVSGLVLISIMAAIVLADPDPLSKLPYFSLAALLPSMFVGGFVCVKRVGEAPLLCGILSGAVATVAFLIFALVISGLPKSAHSALGAVALHLSAVLFSILGAFTGNMKRRSKKRRFG